MKFGKTILRVFTPKVLYRIITTFDQKTVMVVGAFWAAAFAAVFVALLSLWHIGAVKREFAVAEAMEPLLPKISSKPLEKPELDALTARLQKRFTELTFAVGSDMSLTVSAIDGSRFRLWLTALSFIDTISPQYRWMIKEFCVGMKCGNNDTPMKATLVAEKVSFIDPSN